MKPHGHIHADVIRNGPETSGQDELHEDHREGKNAKAGGQFLVKLAWWTSHPCGQEQRQGDSDKVSNDQKERFHLASMTTLHHFCYL